MAFEERVEKAYVSDRPSSVPIEKLLAVPKGQGREKLARRAVANREVLLERGHSLEHVAIAGRDPADAKPGKPQALRHHAERNAFLINVAHRR
jgi:hypothetical protein